MIGVWEWERAITQTVFIDVDMAWDTRVPGESDQLDDTLSYKDVAKRITAVAKEGRFQLVEALAENIAAVLLGEFRVPWCRVRVNKRGAVSSAGDVGVVIERGDPV